MCGTFTTHINKAIDIYTLRFDTGGRGIPPLLPPQTQHSLRPSNRNSHLNWITVPDALLTPDATSVFTAPPSPAAPARKPQLPALTGVRTLLAVNIMFFHFTPPHMGPFYPLINNSYVFVGFFILLSGFILAYNYADRPKPLVAREFWRARFARLYPIYLLSLLLFVGMLGAEWHARSHGQFVAGVVLTPLLMQGWNPDLATFWNTVAWTLSCEAAFYFAFPWLIRLRWPKTPGRLVALLLVIWAVGLIPHALYLHFNPDHIAGPIDRYSSGTWLRTLKYTPLAYLCTFLAGITLGKLQASLTLANHHRAWIAGASLAGIALFFATSVDRVPYVLMHGGFLVPHLQRARHRAQRPEPLRLYLRVEAYRTPRPGQLRHLPAPLQLHQPAAHSQRPGTAPPRRLRPLVLLRGNAGARHRRHALRRKTRPQSHPRPPLRAVTMNDPHLAPRRQQKARRSRPSPSSCAQLSGRVRHRREAARRRR